MPVVRAKTGSRHTPAMKSALRRVRNSLNGYNIGYAHINQPGLRLLGAVYLITFAS